MSERACIHVDTAKAHEQPKSHPECLFSSDNRLHKLREQPSKILCHRESEESALTEADVGKRDVRWAA
jgi:hypothetical protein